MRAWEIIEKSGSYNRRDNMQQNDYRMGNRSGMKENINKLDMLVDEIYECGFEDGYQKAKEEMNGMNERGSYRRN